MADIRSLKVNTVIFLEFQAISDTDDCKSKYYPSADRLRELNSSKSHIALTKRSFVSNIKLDLKTFASQVQKKIHSMMQCVLETSRISVCADVPRRLRSVFTISSHRSIS